MSQRSWRGNTGEAKAGTFGRAWRADDDQEGSAQEIELGGPGEKGLLEWLTKGNVVYKSVGLGLMDLTVGGDLVRLARERGVGTTIEDF